jgi:hypothetical protein
MWVIGPFPAKHEAEVCWHCEALWLLGVDRPHATAGPTSEPTELQPSGDGSLNISANVRDSRGELFVGRSRLIRVISQPLQLHG